MYFFILSIQLNEYMAENYLGTQTQPNQTEARKQDGVRCEVALVLGMGKA